MNDSEYFGDVSKKKIIWLLVAFFVKIFFIATTDALKNHPSASSLIFKVVFVLLLLFAVTVPIAMLFWNYFVSPIFKIRKFKYVHGFVLMVVLEWIAPGRLYPPASDSVGQIQPPSIEQVIPSEYNPEEKNK